MGTQRLQLRRPHASDAQAMFEAYAGDEEVTKYLSWDRHMSVEDTKAFIEFSDREWAVWSTGPLLIELKDSTDIIGSTGLSFETPFRASTGYVLASQAWGNGFASEALGAVVELARSMRVWRLEALCHPEHLRSARVLEKCGFALEGTLRCHTVFPNLDAETPQDVRLYARLLR